MYYVSKLGVMGIRCFSHTETESIRFSKPLTLIVGANGTGKTTIVESLRMALTGDVPLNSNKGHTFLHDPRMENLSEIKGQIRLILEHRDGEKKIGIVRNLQLSMRKDKKDLTFKQLDSVLQVKDANGKVISTSNKCLDVNASILALLKVPKAVLESVILCHQDDSLWPLSDSTALKKRFDELLGFNRYVRTLEVITTLRKKLVKVVSVKKTDLALLQKDDAQRSAIMNKLTSYTNKLENIDILIKDLSANRVTAKTRLDSLEEILKSANSKQEKFDQIMKSLGTQILEDPLEDIVASHAKYEVEQLADQREAEELAAEITSLEQQIDNLLTKKAEFANRHEESIKMMTRRDCLKDEFFQLWFRLSPDSDTNPEREGLETMIQNAQKQSDARADIQRKKQLLLEKNAALTRLRDECTASERNLADARHAIEMNRQRVADSRKKQDKLEVEAARIRSIVSQHLNDICCKIDAEASLERQLNTAIEIYQTKLDSLNDAISRATLKKKEAGLAQEVESLKNQLNSQSSTRDDVTVSLEQARVELKLKDISESINQLKSSRSSKHKTVEDIYSEHRMALDAQTLYTNFREYATRKHKCALCFRPFADDAQFDQHMKALNAKLSDSIMPKVQSTAQSLSKVAKEGGGLSAALCAREQQRSRQEIEQDIKVYQADLETWTKLSELSKSLTQLQESFTSLENVDPNCNADGGRKRQRRSVPSESEELALKPIATLEINKKKIERALVEVLRPLCLSASLVDAQLSDLSGTQSSVDVRSPMTKEEEERLQASLKAGRSKLREAEAEVALLNGQVMTAENELRRRVQEILAGGNSLKRYLDEIDGLEISIQNLQQMADGGDQFDKNNSLPSLQQGLSDDRDCLKVVQKKVSVRGQMIDTLKQNIELKTLGEMNQSEFEKNKLELVEFRSTYDRLTAELHRLQGEKTTYERLCGELRQDVRKFKDLDEQLSRVCCEVFVNQAMSEDLGKYCNALRQSMLVYHNTKLKEINVIAKDLWRTVYAGSDIEYIFLKTERAVVGRSTEDLSYTYKLCMMKNDIVTEMRGRSSAGQKVLASVILRLSLIEVLGKRCGILALDEPTTNLDVNNIESLAIAIGKLASQRRMENFQMIVITHDEDFINKLRQNSTSSCSKLIRDFTTGHTKCINEKAVG